MRLRVATAMALLALGLCGCGSTPASSSPASGSPAAGATVVYAAVGASETAGLGINDQPLRLRAAWPQLFYNEALSASATYFNLGVPGITAAEAATVEVPAALPLHPTVVTVFLGGNDVFDDVTAAQFEVSLRSIVHDLRQGGKARVLVANLPPLEHLPAVLACLPGASGDPPCLVGRKLGTRDQLLATIDAYDAAVARVVAGEGAVLVDLHSQGAVLQANPAYVSSDGFHPSPLGHAAIAQLFLDAYRNPGRDTP